MCAPALDSYGPGPDDQTVVRDAHAGTNGRPELSATTCWARSNPAEREGASKDIGHGCTRQRPEPGRSPHTSIGCILKKRPEEGALCGPVLAGNPVTDWV